ncbi:MAG: carboxymuconolactone decarboxylase family protein [Pseudolabrys sp.]|jgi:uncharacterized peroxidase-related enzyme
MTILTTIDPASAKPAAKVLLDAVQKKLGVTPNMMRVMAANPSVLGAYLGFAGALGGGTLGAKLHEQIALAVAQANGCDYCLAAHSLIGKGAGLDAEQIATARVGTPSDPRTAAVLTLARRLVQTRGRATASDIAQARAASISDAEILEVIAAVALNVFTNYLNLTADTDIDFPPAAKLAQAA